MIRVVLEYSAKRSFLFLEPGAGAEEVLAAAAATLHVDPQSLRRSSSKNLQEKQCDTARRQPSGPSVSGLGHSFVEKKGGRQWNGMPRTPMLRCTFRPPPSEKVMGTVKKSGGQKFGADHQQ